MFDPKQSWSARLSDGLLVFGGGGVLVMTLIVGWQVFARYVLNASPSWSEQAALVLMIWFAFFAAAAGVRESFHIRIEVFARALPAPFDHYCRILAHLIVLIVSLALVVWGGELILRTWDHVIPTLGMPRGIAYLPLPVSGLLMALFAVEQIIHDVKSDRRHA